MDKTQILQKTTWKSEGYYQIAKEGSLDITHPGMKALKNLAVDAKAILDLGCGEGTRLNFLVSSSKKGLGIDISQTAITLAKKSFPYLNFKAANLENLPVENNSFDLVYSAFVLEHLSNPEKVLDEAIRVTSLGGHLVFIAPNFGAPNRVSPPFKGSRVGKFLRGMWRDVRCVGFGEGKINWQQIKPMATKDKYDIDWDTTVEPYLRTLICYLKSKGLKVEEGDTCWELELPQAKFYQKLFKFLGNIHLYPFWLWGPHLLVVAKK